MKSDRDSIADLVHEYCDAVAMGDGRRWAGCWDPDGQWILPGGRGAVGSRDILEMWTASMARYRMVIQHAHDGTVTFGPPGPDGRPASARGRWHISEHYWRHDHTTGILLGHYDDEYRCRPEAAVAGAIPTPQSPRWLFARRTLTVHYKGPADMSGPLPMEET